MIPVEVREEVEIVRNDIVDEDTSVEVEIITKVYTYTCISIIIITNLLWLIQ